MPPKEERGVPTQAHRRITTIGWGHTGNEAATYRRGLTLAPGALLVGLVARPSVAVVGQPLWDDALAQTAQVARLFPDQAVVLVSPDLAGTHIPTSLAYLHDADAILVQERNPDD